MGKTGFGLVYLIAVILLLAGCSGEPAHTDGNEPSECQKDSGVGLGASDPVLVARTEHMLSAHGVRIPDAINDWIWTGQAEDNPVPYPLPYADLAGVTFAVDGDYLYVKVEAYGAYPASEAELPWFGQDQVGKFGLNIALDTDNNESTGSPGDKGAEALLGVGMMTTPACGWQSVYDFFYGPTGIEFPETERWEYADNRKLIVAAWGGGGTSYHVIVYPVAIFGLVPGQTIGVCVWDECESLLYPQKHATLDPLGPAGLGGRVVIQLPF